MIDDKNKDVESTEEVENYESKPINPIIMAGMNADANTSSIHVTEDTDDNEDETNNQNIGPIPSSNPENLFNDFQDTYNEASEEKTVQIPEMPKMKKSHVKAIVITIIIVVLLLGALAFCTVFGLIAKGNDKIISGVKIDNISVDGLTKEEAKKKLQTLVEAKLSTTITLKHKDYEVQITPKQFDASFNIDEILNAAEAKGRSGNIFADNFEVLGAMFSETNLQSSFTYTEETLDSLIKEMENNLPDKYQSYSYSIEGTNLVISRGHEGYLIDPAGLKTSVVNAMNNFDSTITQIEIPVNHKDIDKIDIDKVYSEVIREPKDAYFTKDPYVVYPHVDGVDFAVSKEEAKKLVAASNEETVSIPLTITPPAVTTKQLGKEAFPDELGTFETTYNTSNVNRSTNIRLAAQKIDGTVVLPGETFSYNATVGQRTTAAGFKSAAAYVGGEVKNEIGGGICQVSSTLYNAVLYANLEIEERSNHGFNPGYVAVGRDATVSWGGPDFKFINNRKYPIKIVASGDGGKVSVQIFGLGDIDEPEVRIESYVTRYISFSTVTKEDSTVPKGESKILQQGANGCKSVAYRIILKNGEEISRELLSEDTYNPHNKIVAIGTKRD